MLLVIRDGLGNVQTVTAQSVGTPTDRSGSIAGATSQSVMAANALRSGYLIQNTGANPMTISETGTDATLTNTFILGVGQMFPPVGYIISQTAINIAGVQGDTYTAREW
jgi:hypothetical protein